MKKRNLSYGVFICMVKVGFACLQLTILSDIFFLSLSTINLVNHKYAKNVAWPLL